MLNRLTYIIKFLVFLSMIFFGFNMHAKPDLKNVIIISVDTLRADHLGCYGYPLDTSPAIDAFCRDAVRFAGCYTLTPLTAPSFTTLFTSMPPYKHGAKRNGLSIFRKIKTLPYFLKRFGYRSAAVISNWPLRKNLAGLHKDFDVYYEVFTKKRYMGIMQSEGSAPAVNEKAIDWLEKNHEKRFFLWVQYTEPHLPYILHKSFTFDYRDVPSATYPPGTRMRRIKRYDSEIAYTDFHIGKLIEKLKQLGLYRDALIIFHSDHGESFGEHNYFRHGRKLYNSTLHVPLVVKLPGNRFKNTVHRENVSILDVGPTIFSILDLPAYSKMEGVPLFDGQAAILKRQILLETYGGAVHFKRHRKKYHLKVKPVRYGILSGSVKVIYNLKAKDFEVYDLKEDHFETRGRVLPSSPLSMVVKKLKGILLGKVERVTRYIKANRKVRMQKGALSREDFMRLKSLGYIE